MRVGPCARAGWYLAAGALLASAADATLAVVNARVWTGDPKQPWAAALAASGERIAAVGGRESVDRLIGPGTRVIDARGATVTPGFIDSHIHLLVFNRADPVPPLFLQYVRERNEAESNIAAYARALPQGAWLLAEGWRDSLWGGRPPTRQSIDRLAPGRPAWLVNAEGTAGIASTPALRLASIDSDGHTGLIRGGAMWRVEAAITERSRERDERVVTQTMEALVRAGITSVHHNNGWYDFLVLRRLHRAGRLRVRIYASPQLPAAERLRDYIAEQGRGDSWMHWGGVKGYGAVREPEYCAWVSRAVRAGLQVMVHVGSEKELRTLIEVFQRVRTEQNLADPRFRVEHAHDMPSDLIPMLSRLGVIASLQPPLLAHFDQRTASGMPPPLNLFPARALLDAGVRIAFGSDANGPEVVPPLASIRMALERGAPDGSRMTLDQALRAYTADGAFAEFAEAQKGSLQTGKLADFVLFDRDIFTSLHDAGVRMTVTGGQVMFENAGLR